MRIDLEIPDDSGCLMLYSKALGGREQKAVRFNLAEAIQDGLVIPLALDGDGYTIRVILDEPLNETEEAEWVAKIDWMLKIPDGALIVGGAIDPEIPLEEFLGDMSLEVAVPPGDYRVELYTHLPSSMGTYCLRSAGNRELINEYFQRTRPEQTMPRWLADTDFEFGNALSDEEYDQLDDFEPLEFVVRLTPLTEAPPPLPQLDDGWFPHDVNVRKPELCPLGIRFEGEEEDDDHEPYTQEQIEQAMQQMQARMGDPTEGVDDPELLEELDAFAQGGTFGLKSLIDFGKRFVQAQVAGDKRTNTDLIAVLGSEDMLERMNAANTLVERGAGVIDLLTQALASGEYEGEWFKRSLLYVAGQVGGENAYPLMVKLLDDDDPEVGHVTMTALGELGDGRALEPIVTRLSSDNPRTRTSAAMALGVLGDGRAVEPLLARLGDDDPNVVMWTAKSLGKLGDARAVDPLMAVLNNPDVLGRGAAAEALGELGDSRAIPCLIDILREEDWRIQAGTFQALGGFGHLAYEPMVAALKSDVPLIRASCAQLLGILEDARAVDHLIPLLQDEGRIASGFVHQVAAEALERIGTDEAKAAVKAWRRG